jgi:hypothetical protein
MDKHMQTSFENRESPDADLRYQAFLDIQAAGQLISAEDDLKYRKKYAAVWKK